MNRIIGCLMDQKLFEVPDGAQAKWGAMSVKQKRQILRTAATLWGPGSDYTKRSTLIDAAAFREQEKEK